MRDEIRDSQIPPSVVLQEWAKTIKNKVKCKVQFV